MTRFDDTVDGDVPAGEAAPRRRVWKPVAAALALVVVPSAIGVAMLRSDSVPAIRSAATAAVADDAATPLVADQVIVSVSDLVRPAPPAGAEPSRLKYLGADGPVEIGNGAAIPLGDALVLEVFVSPYPPTEFATDVDFYVTTIDGEPVDDADISIVWDMLFMTHGPFFAAPENIGGGHYLAPLEMFMFGPWELDTTVTAPSTGTSENVTIAIYVWPA